VLTVTEVLVEPGGHQLWVTFADDQTCRVDLTPLLKLDMYRSLRVPQIFARAEPALAGAGVSWPGGAYLDAQSVRTAPEGEQPVLPIACLPAMHRYRPLLPYLQYQLSNVQLGLKDPVVIQRLLQLRAGELDQMIRNSPVPAELLLPRLSDLSTFLTSHFDSVHVSALLRRPWRYGQEQCPAAAHLHTMLGCLQFGRFDLIERPCLLLATGLP
jgi:Protein of unknown function (DUF2442)